MEQINKSSTVDKLGMSFEIARININRDWFTSALLTYADATIPGAKKGSLCAGPLALADKCDFLLNSPCEETGKFSTLPRLTALSAAEGFLRHEEFLKKEAPIVQRTLRRPCRGAPCHLSVMETR